MKKFDLRNDSLDRNTFIEASAGTGKTYSIERIVEKLLLEPRIINGETVAPLKLSEILIVTFTDKACSELKFRLRNSLLNLYRQELCSDRSHLSEKILFLRSLFSSFDENSIYTIHGFCKKNLQEFAFESGFPFSFELSEISSLISSVLQEIFTGSSDLDQLISLFDTFPDFHKLNSYVQDIMKSSLVMRYFFLLNSDEINTFKKRYATLYPDYAPISNEIDDIDKAAHYHTLYNLFHKLAVELLKYKESKSLITFDDMIFNFHNELVIKENKVLLNAIRNKYKVAIIDEFQDTDRQQWEIFKKIFVNFEMKHTLFLVGDPKQSIYRFREADLNVYFEALKTINHKKILAYNYRSAPILTNALNHLFNYKPLFSKDCGIIYENVEPGIDINFEELYRGGDKLAPIEFIDLSCNSTISLASIKLGQYISSYITLMTRNDSEYLLVDKNGNKKKVVFNDIVILTQKNAQCLSIQKQLEKYLIPSVIKTNETVFGSEEAKDTLILLNSIKSPYDIGVIKKALFTCYFDHNLFMIETLDEQALEVIQKKFLSWNNCFYEDSISGLLTSILEDNFVREHLLTLRNGRQKISNIIQIFEILDSKLNEVSSIDEVIYSLTSLIDENNKEYLIRQSKETNAVSIMTMHASKGLEFKIVFIGDCFYSSQSLEKKKIIFFSENGVRKYSLLQNNLDYLEKTATEELEEKKRVLYVAMTRAKTHLIIPLVEFKKSSSMISLLQRDENNVQAFKDFLLTKENSSFFMMSDSLDMTSLVENLKKDSARRVDLSLKCFLRKDVARPGFKITSFSEIAHSTINYDQDIDWLLRGESKTSAEETQDYISLPKGANTGNLLHEIFENIDFSVFGGYASIESMQKKYSDYLILEGIIVKYLAKYDISPFFKNQVFELVFNVLNCPVNNGASTFKLSEIEEKKHELEFIIKVQSLKEIELVFKTRILNESMKFKQDGDYIKGFIDLIFKYEGKFYIADWKSNYLGGGSLNYSLDKMTENMKLHSYYLQYFIYLNALIKLLDKSVAGFDYNRDFGGIYYFFVRGMHPGNKNQEGIFFHRPTEEEYLKFNQDLQYHMQVT